MKEEEEKEGNINKIQIQQERTKLCGNGMNYIVQMNVFFLILFIVLHIFLGGFMYIDFFPTNHSTFIRLSIILLLINLLLKL